MKKAFLCQRSTGMLFDIYNEGRTLFSTVRRHEYFVQQNLGAGAIHSPRASAIAEGFAPKGREPNKRATTHGSWLFCWWTITDLNR